MSYGNDIWLAIRSDGDSTNPLSPYGEMKVIDNSAKTTFLREFGSADPAHGIAKVLLAPSGTAPTLQFRTGMAASADFTHKNADYVTSKLRHGCTPQRDSLRIPGLLHFACYE